MLNKVIITGRLVSDPELRYTPFEQGSGDSSESLLPVITKIKMESERLGLFINLVILEIGENFANWIKKGYLVTVEGRLQTRSYENQQDQSVSMLQRLMCQTLTTCSLVTIVTLLRKVLILDLQKGAFLEVENSR